MYEQRTYRAWMDSGDLERLTIVRGQSDLLVFCAPGLGQVAERALEQARHEVETQIALQPAFATSLEPLPIGDDASPLARSMSAAALVFGVGPMAAVAGAIAQRVGESLLKYSQHVVVENGGDIYARTPRLLRVGLYAGEASPFADRLFFTVDASRPIAVCTSSGTVGPSLSFGKADAVVAIASDAAHADAAATALANRIQEPADVDTVIQDERKRGRLVGMIACCGNRIGLWGELELRPRTPSV